MYEFNFTIYVIDRFDENELKITGSVAAMNECEARNIVENGVMEAYPYNEIIFLNVECDHEFKDFTIHTVETIF